MVNEARILQLLGLIHKSGNLVFGDTLLEKAKAGTLFLVLLTLDIGPASRRKIENACRPNNIPVISLGNKPSLSKALGKKNISNTGVINKGFASKLLELMEVNYG